MPIPANLILKQMEVGPMANFLYFLGDAASKEIVVVDPAWDVDFLCRQAKQDGYSITGVFLTHGHPDHINGLGEMLSRHDVPVYISRHEPVFGRLRHRNIIAVEGRQTLQVGSVCFECLHTPGHTPGSQCLKCGDALITGDTLFIDGCGRCDLPGGDPKKMYDTLYNILMKLPDSTIIYPGHNYGSKAFAPLALLKKINPYLSCHSLEEFLHDCMGVAP